jgi:hypothetical protein
MYNLRVIHNNTFLSTPEKKNYKTTLIASSIDKKKISFSIERTTIQLSINALGICIGVPHHFDQSNY